MKYFLGLLVTIILASTALAQVNVEDVYKDTTANFSGSPLAPLVDLLSPLIIKLSVLVGGIFGLYLILIFLRVYYERKNMKLLQHIRYNLDQQNKHYGIPSSQEKIGFFHRYILDKIFPSHRKKECQPFPSKKEKRK